MSYQFDILSKRGTIFRGKELAPYLPIEDEVKKTFVKREVLNSVLGAMTPVATFATPVLMCGIKGVATKSIIGATVTLASVQVSALISGGNGRGETLKIPKINMIPGGIGSVIPSRALEEIEVESIIERFLDRK